MDNTFDTFEHAKNIADFLRQEEFLPRQQALREALSNCCQVVALAVEIER